MACTFSVDVTSSVYIQPLIYQFVSLCIMCSLCSLCPFMFFCVLLCSFVSCMHSACALCMHVCCNFVLCQVFNVMFVLCVLFCRAKSVDLTAVPDGNSTLVLANKLIHNMKSSHTHTYTHTHPLVLCPPVW